MGDSYTLSGIAARRQSGDRDGPERGEAATPQGGTVSTHLGEASIYSPAPCGRGLGGGVCARQRARDPIIVEACRNFPC
jgi:hypothetical protein